MKISLQRVLKRAAAYAGIALGVLLFICRDCYVRPGAHIMTIVFTFTITIFLFEGNSLFNKWIGNRISWMEYPVWRTVIGVSGAMIYSSLLIVFTYSVLFIWKRGYAWETYNQSLWSTLIISLVVTLIISLLLHARGFLFHWREASLRVERLKREQVSTRFSSLKTQLNPHFLFNNLNTLTALVYKDPDKAADFIKKLSELYRYILEHVEEEVVPLRQELDCLEAYLFLLNLRHGDSLIVHMDIPPVKAYLPPLSLQLLMENAGKHNVISKKDKLHIDIFLEDNRKIVVRNTYNPKKEEEKSTGKGLANIRARYELLTDRSVEVLQAKDYFEVKLPLLYF